MNPNIQQVYTEQELVSSFRQGKPEALDVLYDKYAPVLLGLATRIMRDSETAEAVLQDAFVAIWKRKVDYDATRLSLLSWMILILRDIAVANLKLDKHKIISKSEELLKFASETEKNNVRQVNKEVKASFCNLEPNEKLAIDLVYLKGYSCFQAAAELGVTEETIKVWLKLGGKHLREGRAT